MPRFSVLLPTHNRADVLPSAIGSVLAQTESDFELLIVGDGCTDATAEVVHGLGDSRIRWFDLPKAPHFGYANRNIVLRQATGRLIAYMQHDDLWLPDHLELLSACLEDHGADFAYSRCVWVGPEGGCFPSSYNLHHPPTLEGFLRRSWFIPSTGVLHRRECLEKYGFLDETLSSAADWELWTRFVSGGGRKNFAYQPIPTYLHFRAHWRTEDQSWMPQVWQAPSLATSLMPPVQTVPVAPGMTAQEAVWTQLSADPHRWARDLRTAVFLYLDERAAGREQFALRTLQRLRQWKCRLAPPGSWRDRLFLRLLGRD